MKKIFKITIAIFFLSISISSCGDDDSGEQFMQPQTNENNNNNPANNNNDNSNDLDVMSMTPEEIENFLEERVFENLTTSNENAQVELNSAEITDDQRDILLFGNELHEKMTEAYDDLSNEDRQLLANFFLENNINMNDVISGKLITSEEINTFIRNFLSKQAIAIGLLPAAVVALEFPELAFSKVAAIALFASIVYAVYETTKEVDNLLENIFTPISNSLDELTERKFISSHKEITTVLNFTYGISNKYKVKTLGKKLNSGDISNTNSQVARAATEIQEFQNEYNNIKNKVDEFIQAVGGFFGISVNKLPDTTFLPENTTEEPINISLDNLTLNNLPVGINYNLSVEGDNIIGITFINAEERKEEEEISFTPNLIFDDGNFITSNPISVKLSPIETGFDFSGNWTASWDVETCVPSGNSNDKECVNHQNTRDYIFFESSNCKTLQCGIMDFDKIRNGNTDSPFQNQWTFDGKNLEIKIQSQSSSGFFFDFRDFQFNGIYSDITDSFTGAYSAKYDGGLWRNQATGTLTLTRQ